MMAAGRHAKVCTEDCGLYNEIGVVDGQSNNQVADNCKKN